MTDSEIVMARMMAVAVVNDPCLCQRIAHARGWKPETIRGLAFEPSLGWHDGKLAFLYETGVKLRWQARDERRICWHFGKPWLWRGGYLSVPAFRRVWLTEGESDAIRLIDSGVEDDGKSLVVALPSASTFAPAWASRFRGKDVTLAFDNDDAGRAATARVGGLLRHVARSVQVINWTEALDAIAA